MFRRGKARRPALGTVKLCSGSMVEVWHGAMSCVMSHNVKAVKAAHGTLCLVPASNVMAV